MESVKLPILLKRPRSQQYIVIEVDEDMNVDKDDWFLNVSYRKNNTNSEVSSHCIIRKDLDTWLGSFKRQNYVIHDEKITK